MKSYFSDLVVVDALYCQEDERVFCIEWGVRPELVRQFKSNKVSSTVVKSELVRLKLISTNSTYKINSSRTKSETESKQTENSCRIKFNRTSHLPRRFGKVEGRCTQGQGGQGLLLNPRIIFQKTCVNEKYLRLQSLGIF